MGFCYGNVSSTTVAAAGGIGLDQDDWKSMESLQRLTRSWTRGGLLFGKMWEDAAVELQLARERKARRVLCVASAGDTAFALAALPSTRVTALDINPAQIFLCQIKQAVLRERGSEALASLRYSDARGAIGCETLEPEARLYWISHSFLLREGFHRAGRVDRMMAFWLRMFSWFVVSRQQIDELLVSDDVKQQTELVRRYWQGRRWNLAVKIICWKPLLRLIYGRELTERLPSEFGSEMSDRMLRFLTAFEATNNPYMWQTLGDARTCETLPPYLESWGEVDFSIGTLEGLQAEKFDLFVLSNILEVADGGQISRLLSDVRRLAGPGAVVCMRFMMPRPPVWPEVELLADKSIQAGQTDRAFFCNHFQIYRIE